MITGAVVLLGLIFVGIAGNNSRSALAAIAGVLLILGIPAAFVCATAALWRRLRRGNPDQSRQPVPLSHMPGERFD
jgi:hypothetical protein